MYQQLNFLPETVPCSFDEAILQNTKTKQKQHWVVHKVSSTPALASNNQGSKSKITTPNILRSISKVNYSNQPNTPTPVQSTSNCSEEILEAKEICLLIQNYYFQVCKSPPPDEWNGWDGTATIMWVLGGALGLLCLVLVVFWQVNIMYHWKGVNVKSFHEFVWFKITWHEFLQFMYACCHWEPLKHYQVTIFQLFVQVSNLLSNYCPIRKVQMQTKSPSIEVGNVYSWCK